MREILFRGKRVDNGEWVEGYIVKLGKESFSDPERYGICNKAIPIGGSAVCYNLKINEVIPETIGQYTGLNDKNGTKVFDGDCIGCRENVVEYLDGTFTINGDRPLSWLKGTNGFIIVGNIYDNLELLEVEE